MSITCRLTGNLESRFHRLKCHCEVDISHRLKRAQQSIDNDEGLCCGEFLKKVRMAEPWEATLGVRRWHFPIWNYRVERTVNFDVIHNLLLSTQARARSCFSVVNLSKASQLWAIDGIIMISKKTNSFISSTSERFIAELAANCWESVSYI